MHLLGASVVGFILLPLAFSCEISKNKVKISQEYEHIILKQLQRINLTVEEELIQRNKHCKRNTTFHNIENPEYFIHNASCNRMPTGLETNLEEDLKFLVESIIGSLGCQCPTRQGKQRANGKQPGLRRKLCKLKHTLAGIQKAYEQYNST
ncbi:hypothetical protein AMEX_G2156 [Astyanax mexicanus]|uniref:Interleukin-7 n=1 Tax=Astyanax mexicanus TaxID=7994 RepID=A0A8T2MPP4_ASTMX|nr:hypothetical protein AMEX_G2156 [Astyanax mexicanus]